jgi:hypothetical protein
MKTRIAILMVLVTFTVRAADLVVVIPPNDVARVSEAYGALYGLGHNATMPEVSAITKQWIIGQTQLWERQKAAAAYSPPPLEMQPTPTPTPTATPTATPTPGLRSKP